MLPGVVDRLLPALIVNTVFAATALAEGMVSWSGAVVGGLIGIAIYLGAGWQGWIMLLATFVVAAAVVTALTAGGSDTVASEIGKAMGRRTFLVVGFRPVPAGTPGAISLEGTLAGLVSATALATLGAALGLAPADTIWIVVVGATAGAFVESALAATLESRGILDSHLLNFINTAVAVAVVLPLAMR